MKKITFSSAFHFLISMAVLITAIYFFLFSAFNLKISDYFFPILDINGLFNSNQLSIPYLYHDLWFNHGHLHDWTFSPVPYFFPDTLIGFIVAFFIHSIPAQVLLANAIEWFLYYFLIIQIGQAIYGPIYGSVSKNFFRLSAILLVVLASGHLHDREVLIPLWTSHFGSTVLVYLFSLWLILKYLHHQPKNSLLALLAILNFITSLSDPFFFILLNGSLFFGLLAMAKQKNASWSTCLKLFFIPFLFSILGLLCNFYDLLHLNISAFLGAEQKITSPIHYSWDIIIRVQHTIALYYADNPMIILITFFILLWGIGLFFKAFYASHPKKEAFTHFIIITCSASIFLTLFCSLFLDHDFEKPPFLGLRHFINALILPTFLCLPLLIAQVSPSIFKYVNRYYSLFMAILLASLLLFNPIRPLSELLNYYPPVAQCLDENAKKGDLLNKHGVGGYWSSRFNAVFSKENVQLAPILSAKPYNWMSTKNDYRHQRFYFVLSRDVMPVITTWGKPDKHFVCSQDKHFSIKVYNKGFYIDQ